MNTRTLLSTAGHSGSHKRSSAAHRPLSCSAHFRRAGPGRETLHQRRQGKRPETPHSPAGCPRPPPGHSGRACSCPYRVILDHVLYLDRKWHFGSVGHAESPTGTMEPPCDRHIGARAGSALWSQSHSDGPLDLERSIATLPGLAGENRWPAGVSRCTSTARPCCVCVRAIRSARLRVPV